MDPHTPGRPSWPLLQLIYTAAIIAGLQMWCHCGRVIELLSLSWMMTGTRTIWDSFAIYLSLSLSHSLCLNLPLSTFFFTVFFCFCSTGLAFFYFFVLYLTTWTHSLWVFSWVPVKGRLKKAELLVLIATLSFGASLQFLIVHIDYRLLVH